MIAPIFASVVSDAFAHGFAVMAKSVRGAGGQPDARFRVISSPQLSPLSPEARAYLAETLGEVEFHEADESAYAGLYDYAARELRTPPRLLAAFLIFEAFFWKDVERVVALDSDLLAIGSIETLTRADGAFCAVRARHPETNAPCGYVNTGVLSFLSGGALFGSPDDVVRRARMRRPKAGAGAGAADQALINIVMRPAHISHLPDRLNFTKRSVRNEMRAAGLDATSVAAVDSFLEARGVRILHFIGQKPWTQKTAEKEFDYEAIEEVWQRVARTAPPPPFPNAEAESATAA